MKPSSIVVAVLVLVAIPSLVWMLGPGATWVLENVDGVTLNDDIPPPATLPPNELTAKDWAAAIATVRGNVLAIATGLAALLAVYYTARNADTARRMFRLGERGHDTDRFSKAVEQLGSDQAPVRLGGLYALEQLAQNNPGLRQTVVDVICAYLRMPWTPPQQEDREEQIRAARTRSLGRAEARIGRDPEEEQQVRLTAQRLLVNHLRWRKRHWWQRPTAVNPLFWPGIRLDLTGATFPNFDFRDCRVDRAYFDGVTFTGEAWFDGTTFTGDARFDGTTFTGNARFRWVTFTYAVFARATFADEARFDGTTFTGLAMFGMVTFTDNAWFVGATFPDDAWFVGATFTNNAWFVGATFPGHARFDGTTFTGKATFDGTIFTSDARFDAKRARVTHPDDAHVWPPGWHVETGPKGAVLKPDEPSDDGTKDEQSGGEPAALT